MNVILYSRIFVLWCKSMMWIGMNRDILGYPVWGEPWPRLILKRVDSPPPQCSIDVDRNKDMYLRISRSCNWWSISCLLSGPLLVSACPGTIVRPAPLSAPPSAPPSPFLGNLISPFTIAFCFSTFFKREAVVSFVK